MVFKRIWQGILAVIILAIAIAFIGLISKLIWLLFLFGFTAI